jgi:toxin CcdB
MQFDVYANPNPAARKHAPFVIDLQSDHLDRIATRLCAPLKPLKFAERTIDGLMPEVGVGGKTYRVYFQELAAVPAHMLGSPKDSLAEQRHRFVAAIDLLVTGI